MSDSDRWERGAEKIKESTQVPFRLRPREVMAFSDIMLEHCSQRCGTRDILSMRDRRLILLGAIMALASR